MRAPALLYFWTALAAAAAPIDFNTQIRPILSENCFKCHGFDRETRKASRRLDTREGALAEKEGVRAIVPGDVENSEVHARIHSSDKDDQMPPPKSGKSLTAGQIAILDQWIKQGAAYDLHWSLKSPRQSPIPPTGRAGWAKNPIDGFVLAALEGAHLAPGEEADRETLIRRVSLDLTGLPPSPEEVTAYINDPAPEAYERVVDRLLSSPAYGERQARRWLDLARYADTNGFEKDRERSIWPYRDWVINAFNSGMPFDEFTIEQLAGDLLPNATREQRIATGFHRNTMLNEEGGIDPLEYRFNAVVDRVATTGATWLGLTLQCAQCHTHKYDPITHRDYYQFMAFLDNAEEPELRLPPPDAGAQEKQRAEKLEKLISELPGKFAAKEATEWKPLRPESVTTASGEAPKILPDGSALFAAGSPEKETTTFLFQAGATEVQALRLEALTDSSLPLNGPGRAENGNFVLSEVTVTVLSNGNGASGEAVKISRAEADAAQAGFPIENAIDGKEETGWAVDVGPGKSHANRTATFFLEKPLRVTSKDLFSVRITQAYGQRHTLGRMRWSIGSVPANGGSVEERRKTVLERKLQEWIQQERATTVKWTQLAPSEVKSNLPLLSVQADKAVFVSGDMTKSDLYELTFKGAPAGITALRLEALPDERLPARGPGRIYYEGSRGDFFLSEFSLFSRGAKVPFARASSSYAKQGFGAEKAIDGDPQSGWSIEGREGERHAAVFSLAAPLTDGDFSIKILCERYFAAGLGKFRISATTEAKPAVAEVISEETAALLQVPEAQWSPAQREILRREFLLATPELAAARAEIETLRKAPSWPTTLIMEERPSANPRATFIHHRGEFLQPKERVQAEIPSVLGALPPEAPRNRLTLARWLVSAENPLTARVVMNREWAAFFGRGIVRTIGDFGLQGDPPSHPELLDWLAVEFVKQGWSLKKMQKLIVTSATYRQVSAATPEAVTQDPENKFLARGPRFRLEAEEIRDAALKAAGLLTEKIGGPSVRPPQPEGVTEVAYGSPKWNASTGPDRYRRSLYTVSKRTAPFALYGTFDAPTGEACVVRRDRSDTPLQALALLNDVVFLEAARALGAKTAAAASTPEERAREIFRRCLGRGPRDEETARLVAFFQTEKGRFERGELDAAGVAGEGTAAPAERAAWTALARAIFNFDEFITRS